MAKTKPIGVRFDKDLLETLEKVSSANSPQKALNLYEKSYLELVDLRVKINNQPENKERILEERNTISDLWKDNPMSPYDCVDDFEITEMKERVKVLEKEISKPPTNTMMPQRFYIQVRQKEISELKTKLGIV